MVCVISSHSLQVKHSLWEVDRNESNKQTPNRVMYRYFDVLFVCGFLIALLISERFICLESSASRPSIVHRWSSHRLRFRLEKCTGESKGALAAKGQGGEVFASISRELFGERTNTLAQVLAPDMAKDINKSQSNVSACMRSLDYMSIR
jgi:hypothetical protein